MGKDGFLFASPSLAAGQTIRPPESISKTSSLVGLMLPSLSRVLSGSRCLAQTTRRSATAAAVAAVRFPTRQLPPHQPSLVRPYSSSPPPRRPSPPSQSKSDLPIVPILVLIAIGSGSYVLLARSRVPQKVEKQ